MLYGSGAFYQPGWQAAPVGPVHFGQQHPAVPVPFAHPHLQHQQQQQQRQAAAQRRPSVDSRRRPSTSTVQSLHGAAAPAPPRENYYAQTMQPQVLQPQVMHPNFMQQPQHGPRSPSIASNASQIPTPMLGTLNAHQLQPMVLQSNPQLKPPGSPSRVQNLQHAHSPSMGSTVAQTFGENSPKSPAAANFKATNSFQPYFPGFKKSVIDAGLFSEPDNKRRSQCLLSIALDKVVAYVKSDTNMRGHTAARISRGAVKGDLMSLFHKDLFEKGRAAIPIAEPYLADCVDLFMAIVYVLRLHEKQLGDYKQEVDPALEAKDDEPPSKNWHLTKVPNKWSGLVKVVEFDIIARHILKLGSADPLYLFLQMDISREGTITAEHLRASLLSDTFDADMKKAKETNYEGLREQDTSLDVQFFLQRGNDWQNSVDPTKALSRENSMGPEGSTGPQGGGDPKSRSKINHAKSACGGVLSTDCGKPSFNAVSDELFQMILCGQVDPYTKVLNVRPPIVPDELRKQKALERERDTNEALQNGTTPEDVPSSIDRTKRPFAPSFICSTCEEEYASFVSVTPSESSAAVRDSLMSMDMKESATAMGPEFYSEIRVKDEFFYFLKEKLAPDVAQRWQVCQICQASMNKEAKEEAGEKEKEAAGDGEGEASPAQKGTKKGTGKPKKKAK